MKKLNLRSITAIVAIAIASISYVLMSFGTEEKVESTQNLHWYFHESDGSYSYLGFGENPPGGDPCDPPTSEEEEICMKGLLTNPPAHTVNNSTAAVKEIPREPLSN